MRSCLPVRTLSVLPLVIAILSAFACNGSPSQPGPISDSTSDSPVVPRSRPFDAPPSLTGPADPIAEQPADTEYLEEELTEVSELTDAEDIDDASDLDANDLEATEFGANGLTINAATAGASNTVVLSGTIRDKNRQTLKLAGVTVKAAGVQATSNASGRFTLRIRPGTVTITFKKTGYKTATLKKLVTRATNISVSLTPTATSAALSNLSLGDGSVAVGTTVNATVTLTKAAPPGGARVLLSSSSSAAEVPASVMIRAGSKSSSFKVKAEAVGKATITAKYDKKSDTATLTITGTPPPPTQTPPADKVVASFTYRPSQCEVVKDPNGSDPPMFVICTFDASDSIAPAGSTYTVDLSRGQTVPNGTSRTFTNVPLPCGSCPMACLIGLSL